MGFKLLADLRVLVEVGYEGYSHMFVANRVDETLMEQLAASYDTSLLNAADITHALADTGKAICFLIPAAYMEGMQ